MNTLESVQNLQARMDESIFGQKSVIEQLIIGLLANGNILMEGLLGLAKTRAVKSLAMNMEAWISPGRNWQGNELLTSLRRIRARLTGEI